MQGAMTHPSRALNLDIKQSFFMPKSDITIYIKRALTYNNPKISAEKQTEFGWYIYTFEERNIKMKLHFHFLKTCLAEGIIPKRLIVNKQSAIGAEDETFRNKWKETLNNCSLKLMECLVEYYERQPAQILLT